ncbi:helix-turn-helix domain-containing protein [Bradyrhizobium sp. LLZ17]|uniref:Helix-turn-helix domain-containing protein n=1 Tax=Bradyrhizobium sp. LLZ17 TaxID=3239388 RepID=A0AB39XK89_9BRAD
MTNNRTSTRPWLPDEEAELLSLFAEGATAEEVGERLRRTRQAVYARLQRFQRQRGRASKTNGKSFAQLTD